MLELRDVAVRFGDVAAVDGVSFDVADGEVVAVLGPSGCGKSTLLRVIAGLEPDARGEVIWNGVDQRETPTHRRGFGLMFQDYALFPHRDVGGNVEFGLRMQRLPAGRRREAVARALEGVGLDGYEGRSVTTLSGGERQRVALARALVVDPRLLMLDEPLASLDLDLRARLLGDLEELLAGDELSAIYVTHDHTEAFALADRVAVMRAGRVVTLAAPHELWAQPVDEWTARFLGFGPCVHGRLSGSVIETPLGVLHSDSGLEPGPVRVVIRPGAVRLDPHGPVEAKVSACAFEGRRWRLRLVVDAATVVTATSPRRHPVGDDLRLSIEPDGFVVFAPNVGERGAAAPESDTVSS